MSPLETNMCKSVPLLVLCYCYCQYKGYSLRLSNRKAVVMVKLRSLIFLLHDLVSAFVQFKLPLPILHNINNSMAVVLMIVEFCFEGKIPTKSQKKSILVAIMGIILVSNYQYLEPIIRPSYHFDSSFENYDNVTPYTILFWCFVYLLVVLLECYAIYITPKLQMNTFQVNFYYSFFLLMGDALMYTLTTRRS